MLAGTGIGSSVGRLRVGKLAQLLGSQTDHRVGQRRVRITRDDLLVRPRLVLAGVVVLQVELGAVSVGTVQLALRVLLAAVDGRLNRGEIFVALFVVKQRLT